MDVEIMFEIMPFSNSVFVTPMKLNGAPLISSHLVTFVSWMTTQMAGSFSALWNPWAISASSRTSLYAPGAKIAQRTAIREKTPQPSE